LLLLLPEMGLEKQKEEAKRHGAWLVYGALMVSMLSSLIQKLENLFAFNLVLQNRQESI